MSTLARSVWGVASSLLRGGAAPHPAAAAAQPLAFFSPTFSFTRSSMKVMSALKKRCEHCRLVRRGKILYVYCSVNPRHKARQGPKRRQ